MPVRYKYLPSKNVIYIECYGELTIKEIADYFSDIEKDESIPKGAAEFVDQSRITLFNINHFDASSMPSIYSSARKEKAIIATIQFGFSPLNEGLSRLIAAYFEKYMPEHPFRTVKTYEQALEALREIRMQDGDSACGA